MTTTKPQRVRDPLHNLIEFGTAADPDQQQLEQVLWSVIQTRPFQRLRRIKQLGFSELVFPGATHTRFAHSIGVFHCARQLMGAIRRSVNASGRSFDAHQVRVALAATLVHDVGHGMFSHAFEKFGSQFGLAMAHHETVSDVLIRSDEISGVLSTLGRSFAAEVADMVKAKQPVNLYASVVSSQFDADRLDYMQRDRLMTGVRSSDVDVGWLLGNLEVDKVDTGSDDTPAGQVETLILGHKAQQTAESYVVSLLHLYQNVYGHKTTRGAEMVFFALMCRLMQLQRDGSAKATGLPAAHPLRRFLKDPGKVEHALALDDAVLWGALPQLAEAGDAVLVELAVRLRDRHLPRCIDIRHHVEGYFPPQAKEDAQARRKRLALIKLVCRNVVSAIEAQQCEIELAERLVIVDEYARAPYRRFDSSRTPMNQIHIRQGNNVRDVAEISAVVAGAEAFELCRAYDFSRDEQGRVLVENIMRTEMEGASRGHS